MKPETRRVAIIGGVRIPFCRAHTAYAEQSNQDMMTAALKGLVDKYSLQGKRLGDVSLGAVIMHSGDWNLARECVLGSGLSPETPAFDLRRACGTSLEAAITIGNKIAVGQIEAGIAGGTDTISDTPIVYRARIPEDIIKECTWPHPGSETETLAGFAAVLLQTGVSGRHGTPHGSVDG